MRLLPFLVVSTAVVWLVWRVLLRRDVWLMLRTTRRVRLIVGALLASCAVVVVASWNAPAPIGLALAGLAVVAVGVVAARERAHHGRSRRWPPGPLPVLGLMDEIDDHYLLEQSRALGPIFKTIRGTRPTVCVVGMDNIGSILRTHDDQLTRGTTDWSALIPGGYIRFMDRAAHARYRPLLARLMTADCVERSLPRMVEATDLELAGLQAASGGADPPGVGLHDHLHDALLRLFVVLFYGIEQGTPAMVRIERLYHALDPLVLHGSRRRTAARGAGSPGDDRTRASQGVIPRPDVALRDLIGLLRECAVRPPATGALVARLAGEDPPLLDDDTLAANVVVMVRLGSFDVTGLLLWIWKYLSDFPDWQDRLRSAGAASRGEQDRLADWVVSETLRLEQSEYLKRTVVEPFEAGGYVIPRGWNLQMCLRESHQDAAIFDEPERFRPDRFADESRLVHGYAPFGLGRTSCIGGRLAQVVAETFVKALVNGYAWTVVTDGPRWHDGFHWTPSLAFRVEIEPRRFDSR